MPRIKKTAETVNVGDVLPTPSPEEAPIAPTPRDVAVVEAELVALRTHHDEWMKFRGDADFELATLRSDGRPEDRTRIAELEEQVRLMAQPRPLTNAELAAAYRSVASGRVRLAVWSKNILVDIRDPAAVVGRIDEMSDGWAPGVNVGKRSDAGPPMKKEDARAWVERVCGWTVV